jgi:hypothetical protein
MAGSEATDLGGNGGQHHPPTYDALLLILTYNAQILILT